MNSSCLKYSFGRHLLSPGHVAGGIPIPRVPADSKPGPAWVLQLFSAGGTQLQETHIPIAGDQPDGKRLVAEIRALLETGLDETPNPENPQPANP